jgi:hypothetical protein
MLMPTGTSFFPIHFPYCDALKELCPFHFPIPDEPSAEVPAVNAGDGTAPGSIVVVCSDTALEPATAASSTSHINTNTTDSKSKRSSRNKGKHVEFTES